MNAYMTCSTSGTNCTVRGHRLGKLYQYNLFYVALMKNKLFLGNFGQQNI